MDERRRFDRLLAAALKDHDCPLFVISTVRSDFLGRFQDDLSHLVEVRNGPAKLWTLPQISGEALREVITGPARLADLQQGRICRGSDGLIDARETERILDATGYLTLRRAERVMAKQGAASTLDMLD